MKTKKIAVILSGCGARDGSEIHETVCTLLALDRAGAEYQCLAPNDLQSQVINHISGEPLSEKRNMLIEAARIARDKILDLSEAKPEDYDAVILPGGFGAAYNLSSFGQKNTEGTVRADVTEFVRAIQKAGKPAGFICIAPIMISKIYGPGVTHTIGHDEKTAASITEMGGIHAPCSAEDCVVDKKHKVVSTPAYMLGKSIGEIATGIEKLVHAVLELCH